MGEGEKDGNWRYSRLVAHLKRNNFLPSFHFCIFLLFFSFAFWSSFFPFWFFVLLGFLCFGWLVGRRLAWPKGRKN